MKKLHVAVIPALTALGACFGNPVTYRDEPLVAKARTGMSRQQGDRSSWTPQVNEALNQLCGSIGNAGSRSDQDDLADRAAH
ncbi:hypothetical protein FXN65_14610 [Metapseudomonas lalkuanensis]|uniref:Lipoprotein n=1 Tax=Metapseudomonas lalkuanensis TaxID=2604832 RepID=A0A5J6QL38_9GAMM|nr:hypothetical protein [Pseudomonas lalkuanensis]QEY63224.1 hypothetical protein FXN65_14610 [Pseudomonas lalkuanensis]